MRGLQLVPDCASWCSSKSFEALICSLKEVTAYAIPNFLCNCSSEIPFVSGKTKNTTKNCTTIIAAKNANGSPPEYFARMGNASEIAAFINQCEEDPRLWPFERTRLGNTSAM